MLSVVNGVGWRRKGMVLLHDILGTAEIQVRSKGSLGGTLELNQGGGRGHYHISCLAPLRYRYQAWDLSVEHMSWIKAEVEGITT
jgi:hypothetical protein